MDRSLRLRTIRSRFNIVEYCLRRSGHPDIFEKIESKHSVESHDCVENRSIRRSRLTVSDLWGPSTRISGATPSGDELTEWNLDSNPDRLGLRARIPGLVHGVAVLSSGTDHSRRVCCTPARGHPGPGSPSQLSIASGRVAGRPLAKRLRSHGGRRGPGRKPRQRGGDGGEESSFTHPAPARAWDTSILSRFLRFAPRPSVAAAIVGTRGDVSAKPSYSWERQIDLSSGVRLSPGN